MTMATKTKKAAAPKLNIQHSYITLKLPTGNFTTSYGGAKASGQLAKMPGAFQALDRYVQAAGKTKSFGEAMNDLLDPALLDKLVPGWDKPVIAETFVAGDKVAFKSGLFAKKYPGTYDVRSQKGKYTYIALPNKAGVLESVGFDSVELAKFENK
jgi:hypothetical protein